jgi:RNA polymerase subunit RPABC4/transcription elongation factor Spt4
MAAKLVNCRCCGQALSKRAELCPHCGEPGMPAWQPWVLISTTIIGVLAVYYFFLKDLF